MKEGIEELVDTSIKTTITNAQGYEGKQKYNEIWNEKFHWMGLTADYIQKKNSELLKI